MWVGSALGATYNIGPGQTYTTFTLLIATENLAAGDIVDGGLNPFSEVWDPDGSGSSGAGNQITLRNATILGGGARANCVNVGDDDYILLQNLTCSGATGPEVVITSSAAGTEIDSCTITSSAGRGVQTESPVYMHDSTLTTTAASELFYSLQGNASDLVTLTDNDFINNGNQTTVFIRGDGDHQISGGSVAFNSGTAWSFVYTYNGADTESGTVNVSDVAMTTAIKTAFSPIEIKRGTWDVDIDNFRYTSAVATEDEPVIDIDNQAAPIITNCEIITYVSIAHILLSSTLGNASGTAEITDNALTVTNGSTNYMIQVGTEGTGAGDNDLDGTIITGNNLTGADSTGSTHAILVGYNQDAVIEKNIISNSGFGIVLKGTEGKTEYTSGGVKSNVINSCGSGIRIKGVDDVDIFNNTVSDSLSTGAITITDNVGADPSTGCVLKNNILSSTGAYAVLLVEDTSTILTTDYSNNCLYSAAANIVVYQGVSKTYATWVSDGYDSGSINADPLFVNASESNFYLLAGSPAIWAGTDVSITNDLDGRAYNNPTPSMGVYEFAGHGASGQGSGGMSLGLD